jgi:hypothetical protein
MAEAKDDWRLNSKPRTLRKPSGKSLQVGFLYSYHPG